MAHNLDGKPAIHYNVTHNTVNVPLCIPFAQTTVIYMKIVNQLKRFKTRITCILTAKLKTGPSIV